MIDEWVSRLCFVGPYSVQLPKRCDRVQCGLCFRFLVVQFDDAFTIVGICTVKHGCASGTPGMPSQKFFSSTVTSRTAHEKSRMGNRKVMSVNNYDLVFFSDSVFRVSFPIRLFF